MESRRKILKSPAAKRRSRLVPKDQKVSLERVLGLTVTNNASLACDPNTGCIAYPAGCVVVLYNPKKNKQTHIFNVSKKTLTSLAFSGDGKHLVTGESGHQPAVRVWDVAEKVQVAEFHGHKFGISCVTFSPNLKYIVSIGTQHDMQVNVWNWKTGSKVASNKVSSKVTAVAFSSDGSYFVTAGMRHVRFWYLDRSKSKINETVPLSGRNGILADHKNNFFCDVAMGTGRQSSKTFCVTQSGYLCQFNAKRQMDKWVEVRTNCASSVSAADDYIFVGCGSGIVRVFDASSLHFVVTLPRPHHLGVDIAAAVSPSQIGANKDVERKYPDIVAMQFDVEHRKVTCVYNDHSMYLWDVHDLKKIGKSWSFLYHSSCVYGIEVYPSLEVGQTPVLPPHSFFTCSSDDTIRIWNLDPHMPETPTYKSNIYSNDLLKVMYMDSSLASLCDIDYNPSGATDKTDTNYDDKNGIRSIRVSPDGQHLASGDREGNVRIHNLQNLEELKQIEAHESEVLCLEYAQWKQGPKILASSSRDRLIHVYDVEQQYGLLQTLSDHSSSISAVKFTETDGQYKMLTCGADKSILFRNLQLDPEFQFTLGHHLVEKMTLYDMDVEPSHKFAAIACQDRNVRIYNVKTGKKKKEYKGSLSDDGILLRMKLDPSGSYAVTSCSDKNLCILDFYTGELLATMFGHSEIATDARFMNDTKHLLSSAGDGCIFVWKLPNEMTEHIQSRLQEMGKTPHITNDGLRMPPDLKDDVDFFPMPQKKEDYLSPQSIPLQKKEEYFSPQRVLKEIYPERYTNSNTADTNSISNSSNAGGGGAGGGAETESSDYRFSISQLPSWAKKQVGQAVPTQLADSEQGTGQAPKGRWAQRAEGQGLIVKQQDGKTVEIDIATDRRRFSFEADTLSSQMVDARRETMVLSRPSSTPKNMPVIYDNNNEEEEEEEEDAFVPVSSSTFVKSDTSSKPVSWDDLYNFDNEEEEAKEVIYYPPSESDGSDSMAGSFQVHDGFSLDASSKPRRLSTSMSSNPDADSETTDPVSLEDEEDEDSNHSTPSTPMEEVAQNHHREKFLRETFENLSFTPGLPTDKFVASLDCQEEEIAANAPPSLINSRLSLSARFLSRSQAANIKNMGMYNSIQRQDNWFDGVQRRKDDMARNLDESRRMLMAMGWTQQKSPETDGEDPFSNPSSPPSSAETLNNTLTPSQVGRTLSEQAEEEVQHTPTNLKQDQQAPPPSPRTPKSLRRCWSQFDLPKTPIPEEKTDQSGAPKLAGKRSVSTSNFKEGDKTPKKPGSCTSRPRSLQLDTNKARSLEKPKTQAVAGRKATPTGPQTKPLSEPKMKSSRLSTPNLNRPEPPQENRRMSSGSNLVKSKSRSMHSLRLLEEEGPKFTPPGQVKTRSKWAKPSLSSFGSVPNLAASDDEDDIKKVPKVNKSADMSDTSSEASEKPVRSKASSSQAKASSKTTAAGSRRTGEGTDNGRRSASASRMSSGSTSRSNSIEEKKPSKRVKAPVMRKMESVGKDRDRTLMPPPATIGVAKQKQEAKFMKRAQHATRKSTSDLTLEQAKDILKGNSGILAGNLNLGRRRSSSSSPPYERTSANGFEEEIGHLTDPNILSAATEIEKTASELRRISGPGSGTSILDPSPLEPPERDIPCERDIPKPKMCDNSATTVFSDTRYLNDQDDPMRDSGLSTQEDDDCPSPSVKDRIARLNKRNTDVDRQPSRSPFRDRYRSESPVPEVSPRQTSSVQLSVGSSTSVPSGSTSSTSSTGSNSKTKTTASPRQMQPIPFDPNNDVVHSQGKDNCGVSPQPARSTSGQTVTSPPTGLVSSLDSDGLANHLSPGYHSNTSPQSTADTGHGSDTDADSSMTSSMGLVNSRDLTPADPAAGLLKIMDQLEALSARAKDFYSQLGTRQDEQSVAARNQFSTRLGSMVENLCESTGISLPSNARAMPDEMNQVIDLIQRANSIATGLIQKKDH